MAAPGRRKTAALITSLLTEAQRFDFFAGVRALVRLARDKFPAWPWSGEAPGSDSPPERDAVRFKSLQSRTYAASAIQRLRPSDGHKPPELEVSVMGLTGPNGVLPQHYSQLVIDLTRQNQPALRDFLDLFNHRTISLFYRAWVKYRLPVACEPTLISRGEGAEDSVTRSMYALVGLGSGTWHPATARSAIRNRLAFRDEAFLYFSGAFAHWPRNTISLERAIQELLNIPTCVLQFCGQWLLLEKSEQTQMSTMPGLGGNSELGLSALAGSRVWNVDSKFRIELGPVDLATFQRFTPVGDLLRPVSQFARTYVGPTLDFDVLPVLKKEEVPETRLGLGTNASRLGWDTWVHGLPYPRDAKDAVFQHSGFPD